MTKTEQFRISGGQQPGESGSNSQPGSDSGIPGVDTTRFRPGDSYPPRTQQGPGGTNYPPNLTPGSPGPQSGEYPSPGSISSGRPGDSGAGYPYPPQTIPTPYPGYPPGSGGGHPSAGYPTGQPPSQAGPHPGGIANGYPTSIRPGEPGYLLPAARPGNAGLGYPPGSPGHPPGSEAYLPGSVRTPYPPGPGSPGDSVIRPETSYPSGPLLPETTGAGPSGKFSEKTIMIMCIRTILTSWAIMIFFSFLVS